MGEIFFKYYLREYYQDDILSTSKGAQTNSYRRDI
jgi:hypothetical protein